MRSEDVLPAVGTGLWRWENASGTVTLDAGAARLLGLPWTPSASGTVTVSEALVRAHIHVVDFVELQGVVTLAIAEETLAEALIRVVDEEGRVLRTLRARLRPMGAGARRPPDEGIPFHMVGLLCEIPSPPPGTREDTGRPSPVTGDWRRAREAFLLDAGRALAEAGSTAEVLRVAAGLSMPGFSPDGLAVFGVEGDRLAVIGHHGQEPGAEGPFMDMPLDTDYPAARVARSGRAIYLPTPNDYQRRFPTTWPLAAAFGRQSWAFLPLIVSGECIGAWMAAFRHPVTFTPDERSVLTTVARMLAQALSRTYVRESERELADSLQRTMRPAHLPGIEGMTIAARYVPTGGGLQVGGDWYDVIPLPSGRTAVVIGDVQGHDVRAAELMSQLRIAVRAYASEGHHPDAVLARASRFLGGLNVGTSENPPEAGTGEGPVTAVWTGHSDKGADERFATCLYLEVDPLTGTMDIARAGHPDPAIWMPDGTMLVRPTAGGLPLGIEPAADYPTSRLVLQPGETLLICTDGLIETGGHDVETGWVRIRDVFAAYPQEGCRLDELADALVQAVHGPPSHHRTGPLSDRREDDIALLLLCRKPEGAGGPLSGTAGTTVRRTVLTVAQAEPARVADARHQLHGVLHDWSEETQVDGAVLMLSEMLTNVLVHTDGDALMVAEISGSKDARLLRVEVADTSDELPHRRSPGELASSGRGLLLLESLAGQWGVDPRGEGKCIWFEMREDEDPPSWG